MSYLKFSINHQLFMIDVTKVNQIIPYIYPIKQEKHYSLINCRGEIIPCLDFTFLVSKCFSKKYLDTRIVIVEEKDGKKLGLIVEHILEICQVKEDRFLNRVVNMQDELFVKRIGKTSLGLVKEIDAQQLFKICDEVFSNESRS